MKQFIPSLFDRNRRFVPSLVALLTLSSSLVLQATDPQYYAVQASANVQISPPQISLVWPADPNATGYTVLRKDPSASSWSSVGSVSGSATSFLDDGVVSGKAYEYQISKTTSVGYAGYGYVCAGINAPLIEQRGTIILLVDNLYAANLATELSRLQQDLVGDGWVVVRHDVSRNDTPVNIKNIIHSDYANDPANVRAVFLFGHIPVPYSGNINPDGHPNHQGAWPADVYYADMDGSWTDNSVSNTSAERQANWNIPGDGKFDQNELPSSAELEVGRVDLSNMTCYSNKTPSRSELDLLRQYLNKDHNFRHGFMNVQRRGLICDNFGERDGEAFAASGWRNFSAFFGADNVVSVPGWNYFSTLSSQSYLWSYGCGGGGYYTCDGIGSSDDFANTDVKTVFTLFVGSYFGDWDNESNFLRAPLGSTSSALAVAWAGRPHWFLHHMALGETIGRGTLLSQNNQQGGTYSPQNYGTHGVHVALMGDPSLRMHPVVPPSNLTGTATDAGYALTWSASPDSDLLGYHVYRASSAAGPFERITGADPIAATAFTDSANASAGYTYMVRAIKLEHSASGTYNNPSQGVFFGPNGAVDSENGGGGAAPTVPSTPSSLQAASGASAGVSLSWSEGPSNETGFVVQRKTGSRGTYSQVATVTGTASSFTDASVTPGTLYVYRVAAYNAAGESAFSNEASATTPSTPSVPATAAFVAEDTTTEGDWSALYGSEGFNVIGNVAQYPAYAVVTPNSSQPWTWLSSTAERRALQQRLSTDRIAASWFASTAFSIDLDLRDARTHRVSLYFLDWDTSARQQTIEIADAVSGETLDTETISGFHNGAYLTWNLSGHIVITVTALAGSNAVVSALFFDPAAVGGTTVSAPTISPDGGPFNGSVSVSLASPTPGAEIHYTLDGTEPTLVSPSFTTTLMLSSSTTVKAKAYKTGMTESATVTADFSSQALLSGRAQAVFVKADTAAQGNWKGVYGADGYNVLGDNSSFPNYPAYVQVNPSNEADYLWSDTTTEARAMQKANAQGRVAACWYQNPSFDLDLKFTDGRTHRLALYFVDWDNTGRTETVQVLDAATGTLLDSQTLSAFSQGEYLVWDMKGHVRLHFQKVAGSNAILMGLFFSPSATQFSDGGNALLKVGSAAGTGGFQLHLLGETGQSFLIQGSSDMVHWANLAQVVMPAATLDWVDPTARQAAIRFYRAIPAVSNLIPPAATAQ